MTDIILWRHAEAEDASVTGLDADRVLTRRGRKDAVKMARWLKAHLPADTLVLTSPAQRCCETVAALAKITDIEVRTADFLGIDSNVENIAREIRLLQDAKTIMLVGHQPNLGDLIANMLKMQAGVCVVKKGAVWWLRQRLKSGEDTVLQTFLLTAQHPDYL